MSWIVSLAGLSLFILSCMFHLYHAAAGDFKSGMEPAPLETHEVFPEAVPTPPTYPDQFNISFAEILVVAGIIKYAKNNGTWYYDWTNKRARFDHLRGQKNNFCDGQGLSDHDPKAPCSLIFTPDEKMYVHYPEAQTCCYLCGAAEGCTMLRPDWLKENSTLMSVETINGAECYGFGKKGAVADADVQYSTEAGELCRYHEVVDTVDHNLTFYRESFSVGTQPDSLFDVPEQCLTACPHPYVPPKRAKSIHLNTV